MSAGSLLIISGPPGAGKSAAGTAVAAAFGQSVLVAGDTFFGFVASGAVDPRRPDAHPQNTVVIEAAAAAAGQCARPLRR